jgi:dTDP-glucose 4,6-dehydratase
VTRVLITGGAGFIGRHLVRYLLKETDWDLTIMDRLGEGSNLTELAPDRIRFWWHDLKARIGEADTSFGYIIHLAAGSHVDRSIQDPEGFVQDNVLGTCNLLQFARRCAFLQKLLHFSTDEVFGAAGDGKSFDEYDSFHPTNPYSASKAAAEALCPAWANTYGLPIVVTRCTNVAGAGQSAEKFIPNTIAKVRAGSTVQIHSRAGVASSRKYIDVEDVCAATLTVLLRGGVISGRGSGYYNIASDHEYCNVDVAKTIAGMLDGELRHELVEDPPNRPRPDMRYDLDNTRLKGLGWSQRVGIAETLQRCVRGAP